MRAHVQVGRAKMRTLLPDAHIARELNALTDGRCPVCNFPASVKGDRRIHTDGASYAVLVHGCDNLAVTERRRIDTPRPHR